MDTVKVLEMGSREYSSRRADYFLLKKGSTLHENICAFVGDLDVDAAEFDIDYSEFEGVLVSGNNDYGIIITNAADGCLWLVIDSEVEKEKIMSFFEKYFVF